MSRARRGATGVNRGGVECVKLGGQVAESPSLRRHGRPPARTGRISRPHPTHSFLGPARNLWSQAGTPAAARPWERSRLPARGEGRGEGQEQWGVGTPAGCRGWAWAEKQRAIPGVAPPHLQAECPLTHILSHVAWALIGGLGSLWAKGRSVCGEPPWLKWGLSGRARETSFDVAHGPRQPCGEAAFGLAGNPCRTAEGRGLFLPPPHSPPGLAWSLEGPASVGLLRALLQSPARAARWRPAGRGGLLQKQLPLELPRSSGREGCSGLPTDSSEPGTIWETLQEVGQEGCRSPSPRR